MNNVFQQFRDLPYPTATFERLFHAALESLLPDLADAPWYVRERDVVSLFVFGHLVPLFQAENLDIRQIGIEIPVQKLPESSAEKLGRYADIVVWPHNKATVWQTCKPLVQIEWKNISCREKHPSALKRQHAQDIRYLTRDRQYACVSYAVLTEWHPFPHEWRKGQRDWHVEVCCKRISDAREPADFFSAPLRCAATCPESAIAVLRGPIPSVRLRPPDCPYCTVFERSRAATGEGKTVATHVSRS